MSINKEKNKKMCAVMWLNFKNVPTGAKPFFTFLFSVSVIPILLKVEWLLSIDIHT